MPRRISRICQVMTHGPGSVGSYLPSMFSVTIRCPDRRPEPPRPPGRRRGDHLRRLPRRPQPVRLPELAAAGLEAWTVREIWYSAGPDPDHPVDITDTFDRKLSALRAHVSQVAHLPDLESMLRERLELQARTLGLPEGRLAEAFTVIRTE
jgi:LmbE family N-acetylglucosaminyl deacetylase